MKRFFQLVILVMLAIYNAICVVTGGAHLKKLVPSGVIQQGILGGFSGKVGPVVGGKWKDIDYMRGYVTPANPNSEGQQTVRAKFAALVFLARKILNTILQPYWDPFYSNMSGFNKWISLNYVLSDVDGVIDETAIMSKGSLHSGAFDSATYATATGVVLFNYTIENGSNGLATDLVVLVCYDAVNKEFFVADGEATREDGMATLTMTSGLTPANVIGFLFFRQGTGSEIIVSDNISSPCSAP